MRGSDAIISIPSQSTVPLITAPPPTIPLLPVARSAIPLPAPNYTEDCLNKYCRFSFNSREVSYVLLRTFVNRPAQAIQYSPPIIVENTVSTKEPSPFLAYTIVPTVHYLPRNICAYGQPNGQLAVSGEMDQQMMRSKRAYYFQIQEDDQEPAHYAFHPCSPTKPDAFKNFNMPIKLFANTETAQRIIGKKSGKQKTGKVRLNKYDILERDKITSRNPDQNTVMGLSAVTEMANAVTKYESILTEDAKKIMQNSSEAELNAKKEGQIRTEWGHGNSFRHTPMSENPQHKDNLAAMRKCHNTEMMILEGVAKWFALNIQNADVETRYVFDMLLDSDVVTHIHFCVMIIVNQFKIKLTQSIDTLTQYPAYVKTSDLAGLIHILFSMINHIPPRFTQPIDILLHEKSIEKPLVVLFNRKRQPSQEQRDDEPAQKKQRLELL